MEQDSENLTKMEFTFPYFEINQIVEETLKRKASTKRLKGFRPGKVPFELVKKKEFDETFDEVTKQKILAKLQEHRANNKLISLLPVETTFTIENDTVRCSVQALFASGPSLESVESDLRTDGLFVAVYEELLEDDLSKLVDAIKEVEKFERVEQELDIVSSDSFVVVSFEFVDRYEISYLSFDRVSREFFERAVGKRVGECVKITVPVDGIEKEVEFRIINVYTKKERENTVVPSVESFRDRLKNFIEVFNEEQIMNSVFQFIWQKCLDCGLKRILACAESRYGMRFNYAQVESIIVSFFVENLSIQIDENELRKKLMDDCIKYDINPMRVSPAEFEQLKQVAARELYRHKVAKHFRDLAEIKKRFVKIDFTNALALLGYRCPSFFINLVKKYADSGSRLSWNEFETFHLLYAPLATARDQS
ncbi:MAG: trigger factor family protein [Deltaproteobacteria bacterium]|nr:trigger factor family protein [Deltaproteobacteria bacterium]